MIYHVDICNVKGFLPHLRNIVQPCRPQYFYYFHTKLHGKNIHCDSLYVLKACVIHINENVYPLLRNSVTILTAVLMKDTL